MICINRSRAAFMARALIGAALAAGAAAAAAAEPYPGRPIRLVVPYPAGGSNDILARLLAQKLSDALGVTVVVDNRGGASGMIGADIVAKAAANGYTLLLGGTSSLSILPHMYAGLPYNAARDFAPVGLLAVSPNILIAHPSIPVSNVKDLVALAKARPGQLNFALPGLGTQAHIAAEWFRSMARVDIVMVPYKGAAPALVDLLGGQVQLCFVGISSTPQLIRDGKVKALAVTSAKRTPLMPEMPTIAESGLPGFDVDNWYGVVAPTGTPASVIARLNDEMTKILGTPDMKKRFAELGAEALSSTPAQLRDYMRLELAKWGRLVRATGAKAE
jgi:tripartite-type tricarboxylate transporter receptor subunit TctC